jgi:murein L,D-transpeptidase YcbB/YkuD
MRKIVEFTPFLRASIKVGVFLGIILHYTAHAGAGNSALNTKIVHSQLQDTSVSAVIKFHLTQQNGLNYPLSVLRFYELNNFKLNWIAPETVKTHTGEAMLLLDCVLHYGLNHSRYHPNELLYETLQTMVKHTAEVSNLQKAKFDILLTDAIITLINDLHFGKFNPNFSAKKIDQNNATNYSASTVLNNALMQNDFMTAVEQAQPNCKAYSDLQVHMRVLTGQYACDNYVIPEEDIRIMAVNMERLRWINGNDKIYLNIPSYVLKFRQADSTYVFKVSVGKTTSPTPVVQNIINSVKTGAGQIIFNFSKPYKSYVGSTSNSILFKRKERATSDGSIYIDNARKLAELVLGNSGNAEAASLFRKTMKEGKPKRFILIKNVPITITYLTCEVIEGLLVKHKDIYNLDKYLADELYNTANPLASRSNK